MGNWYWFLVLRFNGMAMGMLFAFSFSDYVGAQNLEPSNHGNLERGFIVAPGVPARDIHAPMYAPSLMTISRSVQTR